MMKLRPTKKQKAIMISYLLIISLLVNLNFIGALLNDIVMEANGDKMPVHYHYRFVMERHFGFKEFEEVKYPYLSDIIPLGNTIFSIGDIIMYFTEFALFPVAIVYSIKIMKSGRKTRKTKRSLKTREGKNG